MSLQPDTPGHDDPGPGRRLGIDLGAARIGLAYCDRDTKMALPLETVARSTKNSSYDGPDIETILDHIEDLEVVEVVIGLPRTLGNKLSQSALDVQDFAKRLRIRFLELQWSIPVRYADERLTTVIANQALRSSEKSQKRGRAIVDQIAAVEILQSWLDARAKNLSAS